AVTPEKFGDGVRAVERELAIVLLASDGIRVPSDVKLDLDEPSRALLDLVDLAQALGELAGLARLDDGAVRVEVDVLVLDHDLPRHELDGSGEPVARGRAQAQGKMRPGVCVHAMGSHVPAASPR